MSRTSLLLSPGFLLGLATLAVNDFFLKSAFHNTLTGKLSDFAGLWAFGIFLVALIPKHPRLMLLISGSIFLYWKSSYSQPLIDSWNTTGLPAIGRTVDLMDYLAFIVLPFAYSYIRYRSSRQKIEPTQLRRLASVATIVFSLVFFTATQFVGDQVCCSGEYQFKMSKEEFLKRLKLTGVRNVLYQEKLSNREDGDWYSFSLKEEFCGRRVSVNLHIKEHVNETQVSVAYIFYNCQQKNDTYIQQRFEQEVIDKIKNTP